MKEDNRIKWKIFGSVLLGVILGLVLFCIGAFFFEKECIVFLTGALLGAVGGAISYHIDLNVV